LEKSTTGISEGMMASLVRSLVFTLVGDQW
jgi:hypothetical protein